MIPSFKWTFFFLLSLVTFSLSSRTLVVSDRNGEHLYFYDAENPNFPERLRLKVPKHPHEIAVSPHERYLLVTHYGSTFKSGRSITLIDLETEDNRVQEIQLPEDAKRPHGVTFINETEAYFTVENQSDLYHLKITKEGTGGHVEAKVNLNQEGAFSLVSDPIRNLLYVAHRNSGLIQKINLEAPSTRTWFSGTSSAEGMALSSNGNKLFVTDPKEDKLYLIDTDFMHSSISLDVSKDPARVTLDEETQKALITSRSAGVVDVVDYSETEDHRSPTIERTFSPVGTWRNPNFNPAPLSIATLGGPKALVANTKAHHISVVDYSNGTVEKTFRSGKEPYHMILLKSTMLHEKVLTDALESIEAEQFERLNDERWVDGEGYLRDYATRVFKVIEAPKAAVWRALTNYSRYPEWNEFMVRASLDVDKTPNVLSFKVMLNGTLPNWQKLPILTNEPGTKRCWGKTIFPGFHVKRCFTLKSLGKKNVFDKSDETPSPPRTLYYTEERFGGCFAGSMFKTVGPTIRRGFEQEAENLKNFSEDVSNL